MPRQAGQEIVLPGSRQAPGIFRDGSQEEQRSTVNYRKCHEVDDTAPRTLT